MKEQPSPPQVEQISTEAPTQPAATSTGAAYYLPKVVAILRELGGKAKASQVRSSIVAQMSANNEVIDETEHPSGEPKYQTDIRFARMHLVNAGKLEPPRNSWRLVGLSRTPTVVV